MISAERKKDSGKKARIRFWLILTLIVAVVVLAIGTIIHYHNREGMRLVLKMGTGINLGNSLDVTGVSEKKKEATIEDYETYWNNPPILEEHFEQIKKAGFQTVRIPVSFSEHMTQEGLVDTEWMDRVEMVVRQGIKQDLYVILDTHHEVWLVPSEEKEQEVTEKFCFLWEQIASRFLDVDEKLLFEGMNEPRIRGSEQEWSGGDERSREIVNHLNDAFVKTVRESGGKNKERYLILTTYGGNYKEDAIRALKLPKDRRIIVSVHAYLPYSFALSKEGTSTFSVDSEKKTEPILIAMEMLEKTFLKKGIPVLITEFGCINKDNLEDRIIWTNYYVTQARERGIGVMWWDDGSGFQLLDRSTGKWVYPDLVRVLTRTGSK